MFIQRRAPNGSVAVEFALTCPVLLMLMFGVIEWGWYMSRSAIVVTGAQEGGRAAIATGTQADLTTAAEDQATQALASVGVTSSTVTATWDGAQPGYVTVAVSVAHQPLIGLPYVPVPSTVVATHVAFVPR